MVHSQSEAKRFFVDKVIQRARSEGVSLSDAERRMLLWSESDPASHADPRVIDRLASEMSDEQYEAKIGGLLERSFAADTAANPQTRDEWRDARSVLAQGDHYILVMIDLALRAKLKRWWEFWR